MHPELRPKRTMKKRRSEQRKTQPPRAKIDTVPAKVVERTLCIDRPNNFTAYLNRVFGSERAVHAIWRYKVGTWPDGRVVFWRIDGIGQARSGKLMHYAATGRRCKHRSANWVHTALKLDPFKFEQCFFGEHLIMTADPRPLAVVESEKTAIVASMFFPKYIWLATGGSGGLKMDRLIPVSRKRHVRVFPDGDKFTAWSNTVETVGLGRITVSDFLEKSLSREQKEQGLDLADLIEDLMDNGSQKGPR